MAKKTKYRYRLYYAKRGLEFLSDHPLFWHEQRYLKTFDGPYKELYEAMRHYGVDWFMEEKLEISYPYYERTPEFIERMRQLQRMVWSNINTKGRPHYRCKNQEWPREGLWRVINSDGLHYVQNLKKWCASRGYDYHKVRRRYRYNTFPYQDIEGIIREK